MKAFKIISRETVLYSPYCPIEKHLVELPNRTITEWFVNTNFGAVIVVPILKSGEILLQKSYKHGCQQIITEFCAGMIDEGEIPEKTAHRELLEETGHQAQKMTYLGSMFANPTGSEMQYFIYLAEGCEKTDKQNLDESEQIEIFTVPDFFAAQKMLTDSKNKTSSATLSALYLAENYRKGSEFLQKT